MKPEELAKRLGRGFEAQREQLMTKATLAAQAASQKRTPVKTGTLRRSETTRVESGGLRGYVGTNIKYAPFVHDGTKHMRARPFFAEGIRDARPVIERLMQDAGEDWAAGVAK